MMYVNMKSYLLTLLVLILASCQTPEYEIVKIENYVVDSVWTLPPGHQSTMQVDPVYCYRYDNQIHCRRQPIKVGDTISFHYIKVVKDTI